MFLGTNFSEELKFLLENREGVLYYFTKDQNLPFKSIFFRKILSFFLAPRLTSQSSHSEKSLLTASPLYSIGFLFLTGTDPNRALEFVFAAGNKLREKPA